MINPNKIILIANLFSLCVGYHSYSRMTIIRSPQKPVANTAQNNNGAGNIGDNLNPQPAAPPPPNPPEPNLNNEPNSNLSGAQGPLSNNAETSQVQQVNPPENPANQPQIRPRVSLNSQFNFMGNQGQPIGVPDQPAGIQNLPLSFQNQQMRFPNPNNSQNPGERRHLRPRRNAVDSPSQIFGAQRQQFPTSAQQVLNNMWERTDIMSNRLSGGHIRTSGGEEMAEDIDWDMRDARWREESRRQRYPDLFATTNDRRATFTLGQPRFPPPSQNTTEIREEGAAALDPNGNNQQSKIPNSGRSQNNSYQYDSGFGSISNSNLGMGANISDRMTSDPPTNNTQIRGAIPKIPRVPNASRNISQYPQPRPQNLTNASQMPQNQDNFPQNQNASEGLRVSQIPQNEEHPRFQQSNAEPANNFQSRPVQNSNLGPQNPPKFENSNGEAFERFPNGPNQNSFQNGYRPDPQAQFQELPRFPETSQQFYNPYSESQANNNIGNGGNQEYFQKPINSQFYPQYPGPSHNQHQSWDNYGQYSREREEFDRKIPYQEFPPHFHRDGHFFDQQNSWDYGGGGRDYWDYYDVQRPNFPRNRGHPNYDYQDRDFVQQGNQQQPFNFYQQRYNAIPHVLQIPTEPPSFSAGPNEDPKLFLEELDEYVQQFPENQRLNKALRCLKKNAEYWAVCIRPRCFNYAQLRQLFLQKFLGFNAQREFWQALEKGSYQRDGRSEMVKYFTHLRSKQLLMTNGPNDQQFLDMVSYHFPSMVGTRLRGMLYLGRNMMEEALKYLEWQDDINNRNVQLNRNVAPQNPPRTQERSQVQGGSRTPTQTQPQNTSRSGLYQNQSRNQERPQNRPAQVRNIQIYDHENEEEEEMETVADVNHIIADGEELLEEAKDNASGESPRVPGKIGGIETNFLIDSGSQVSLISFEMFDQLKCRNEVLEEHPAKLVTQGPFANSKKNKTSGQILAEIRLNGSSFLNVFVISPLRDNLSVIIGDNFLKENKCLINYKDDCLTVYQRDEPMHFAFQPTRDKKETKIARTSTIFITLEEAIEEKLNEASKHQQLEITEREKLRALLMKHKDVFSEIPGRTQEYTHEIKLADKTPFYIKPYPIPLAYREKIKNDINQMLNWGIISKSATPYISPIFPIRKQDGNVRREEGEVKQNGSEKIGSYLKIKIKYVIDQ